MFIGDKKVSQRVRNAVAVLIKPAEVLQEGPSLESCG